jgi:hypothetical protein
MGTTLPTDSNDRKNYALFSGCLRYFPAALAGISKTSKLGNDKHNPGQELHHARNKSGDHGDCILRHLMDLEDLVAASNRGDTITQDQILSEVDSMAWRALALSQELHEKFGAPMAPGAKGEKAATVDMLKKQSAKKLFSKGDVVRHINNEAEVTVEALYYDDKGNPILFVRDADEKIFGVDPNFYKSIYVEKEA